MIDFQYPPPMQRFRAVVRNNSGSDAFIFGEVFDHRYYNFDISTPTTILDLGANAGFTAMFFGRKYPDAQLACVEPIPSNAAILRTNLEVNQIEARVFEAAISIADGELEMDLHPKDYGHSVTGTLPAVAGGKRIRVPAISVPTLLDELHWQRVGLLKIDIEGYERELLTHNCDWLHRVDAIAIEYHYASSKEDLGQLAKTFGFTEPRSLPGVWLLTR